MLRTTTCLLVAASFLAAADLPRVDLHVHIHDDQHPDQSLSPAQTAAIAAKLGVRFGVLAEGGCRGDIHDDASLREFLTSMTGQPLWRGLQVYGFDWQNCLGKALRDQLDYISADALIFPDNGQNVRLWLANVQFPDAQNFMDRYVDFNTRVLAQSIQVWANPTYLPESMKDRYDELWTPARMDKVIAAAVKNHVAIEINAKFQIPSLAFLRRAKAAGAKFTIGSNQHVHGIGEIDWCLRVAKEAGLTDKELFVPARSLR